MRITEPGYVSEDVLFLGTGKSGSYLVMGEHHALVGAGVAWEVTRLEEQFDRFGVDRDRLRYLVISHVHHDHCGAAPYLCRRYPHLETVSSAYGAHLLVKPEVVDLMYGLNRSTLERAKRPQEHDGIPISFGAIEVRHVVGDGDRISLGENARLEFYNTPGHSRCSLSVYLPERKMLFPGDSLPYPEPGKAELIVAANHDFNEYVASLEKLETLPVEMVAYEHGGVLSEEDAAGIVTRGLDAAYRQRERIRSRYEELRSVDLLVDELTGKYRELELFRLLPQQTLQAIVRKMTRSALGMV